MTHAGEDTPAAELEETPCAICGRDDSVPILRGRDVRRQVVGEFSVVRCRHCGLAYVNPRPTPRGIAPYYTHDYGSHDLKPPSLAESQYYRLFRKLSAPSGARVLDVGCGGGKYLRFLQKHGYHVEGVEVKNGLARRLRDELGLRSYDGTITQARIPEGSFDVVTFWWVLEHTHDPVQNLRAAHRVLKPGGTIVVALQNFASLGRLLFGSSWHHLDLPGHLYQFEPRTLSAALRLANFEPIRLRQDLIGKDFAPSLGYALGLERSLDRPLPNLLSLPFDLLAWCVRRSGLITAYARRL